MSRRANRNEWDHLAGEDPMWAIASIPGREGTWTEEEFFTSGHNEVAAALAGVERLGVTVRDGRALDFGCGLGRLSRALSERFGTVVGVDVSPEMLARARRLNADRPNVTFSAEALSGFPSDSFDLVLSLVTLQHIPDLAVTRECIAGFVRIAAPGGVIVFGLPTRVGWRVRFAPRALIARLLWRLPFAPAPLRRLLGVGSHTLNGLPEAEVRALLTAGGATVVAAYADDSVGSAQVPTYCYVAIRS